MWKHPVNVNRLMVGLLAAIVALLRGQAECGQAAAGLPVPASRGGRRHDPGWHLPHGLSGTAAHLGPYTATGTLTFAAKRNRFRRLRQLHGGRWLSDRLPAKASRIRP